MRYLAYTHLLSYLYYCKYCVILLIRFFSNMV
nr:MAG TPA: hypothetical protein [Bacteriophage sp.]